MPVSPRLTAMVDRALSNKILSNKEAKRIYNEAAKDGVSEAEVNHIVDALAEVMSDGLQLDTDNRKKRVNVLLGKLEEHHDLGLDDGQIDRSGTRNNYLDALIARGTGADDGGTDTPTPPVDGGGTTTPPVDGGGTTTPPVDGGGTDTPPVDGGGTDTPPVDGGGADTPPVDGGGTDTPPVDGGGGVDTPPVDGGGSTGGTSLQPAALATKGFGGQTAGIDGDGHITLDGAAVKVDVANASQLQQDAVMALSVPGALDGVSAEHQQKLAGNLLGQLTATMPLDGADPKAFLKNTTQVGALGALAQMGAALNEGQVDQLLALTDKTPNPMATSLILRALEGATLNDDQKSKLAALETPDTKDELLKAWDSARSGEARAGWTDLEGPMAQLALAGLCYAKTQDSVDALLEGFEPFKDLNKGSYDKPFDTEEVGHLNRLLAAYTQKHEGLGYVFGTWKNDAPKHLAEVTNQRVQEKILPLLDGANPSLDGVPLTGDQAAYVKTLADGLKDDKAVTQLAGALKEAAFLTSRDRRPYGGAPDVDQPLSPSAFELFQRTAHKFGEMRDGTEDGMIDARGLAKAVQSEAGDVRELMQPIVASLGMDPPRVGDVEVSDKVADLLMLQFTDHTRSSMSVENLQKALQLVADKSGGSVTSDEASDVFSAVIDSYKSNWPDLQTFDFNKLERIAKFKVEGKDVPLCKLNGDEIGLSEFSNKVAETVAKAMDTSRLEQPWMADRWGFRAKASVELLDIFAEKASEGKGPVALLMSKHPGKQIEVVGTGRDGAHDQFAFRVKDGNRTVGTFGQASDGTVAPYRGSTDPELFTASVNADGSYDLKVPSRISTDEFPIQTTYGLGDSIDVGMYNPDASERRVEGEKFETRYAIVEGKITGFTPDGEYTVAYKKADGSDGEKKMSLDDIRTFNHPHYYSEHGSSIRDMKMNVDRDPALKSFLDDAQPIIDRHLPQDGSLANMSPKEIAKRQKACVDDIMAYCAKAMKYPASKDSARSDEDKRYHELDSQYSFPLGELLKINRGMCRHQCVGEMLLLQRAGIDARLASGAANTGSGNYRGLHLWLEINLADDTRYLSDQTWKDEAIPLWNGAYDSDARRLEIYNRTDDFDRYLAD